MDMRGVAFLWVEKKKPDDHRPGEYYMRTSREGCGCCADEMLGLYPEDEAIDAMEQYLAEWDDKLNGLRVFLHYAKNERELKRNIEKELGKTALELEENDSNDE